MEQKIEKAGLRTKEEIMNSLKYRFADIRYDNVFKGKIYLLYMQFYNGLTKEEVIKIYTFVIKKRIDFGMGQRKLYSLVKEEFGVEIKESTISGWIFRKVVPFANEKTQFKAKPMPNKEELYELYTNQKQSAEKLGERFGVSTATAINWLKYYKIPARTHLESMNTPLIKSELREQKLKRPKKDYLILTPEKAYILGVLCGDGHITKEFISLEIRFDEEFAKEFADCFEKVYGLRYTYRYYKKKNTFNVRINNQLICDDLLSYGKFGCYKWEVPQEIMLSGNEKIIGNFLRGFYDSEGCAARSVITSSSVNKGGIEGISTLLKGIGIKTSLKPQQGGRYYVLYICRKGRFQIFKDKVGFTIKRKQDKVNETLNTGFFTKRSVA